MMIMEGHFDFTQFNLLCALKSAFFFGSDKDHLINKHYSYESLQSKIKFVLKNMQLRITPTRLISEVQQEFNKEYPFLKLEFFRDKVSQQQEYATNQVIPHTRRIGDGQGAIADGVIEIGENMKVKELEKIFKDQFRLNVQVYRRSGNLWLQTTMTDDWTLKNQNEHGMEISLSRKTPLIDETDNESADYN
jgi:hypothetical protein